MDPSVVGPEHGTHLEAMECTVYLLNDVACIELKQEYSYVGPPPGCKERDLEDLLYVFPPGRDAVLCDVHGRLGRRRISSHIQQQSLDGRRVKPIGYEYKALGSNEETQFDRRYVFLGKLCSGEDAEVIVTYTVNCDVKEGTLLFTLPHMYCPPALLKKCRSTDTGVSDKITNKERELREAYPLKFTMDAFMQGEITANPISKNSHRLAVTCYPRGEAIPQAHVSVNLMGDKEGTTPSVEDLVIEFQVSFFADPSLYLLPPALESADVNLDSAILLFSKEELFQDARTDLIVVVDFPKKPLQAEVEQARMVVGGLLSAMMDLEISQRDRIFVNVYLHCTVSTVIEATRGLASLNEEAVNNANAVLQKLNSTFSGTDETGTSVSRAFGALLQQRKAATDNQLRVLLLTNGWSEELLASVEHKNAILTAAGEYAHCARLFLGLLGDSTERDQDFAECIACAGNGRAVVVPSKENMSESFFQELAADVLDPCLCKCHLPEEFVHLSRISYDAGAAGLTKLHALRKPSIAWERNLPATVTIHGTKFEIFDCSNKHRLVPRIGQSVVGGILLDTGNDCFNRASGFLNPASVVGFSQKFRVEAPMTDFVVCSETERLRMPRSVLVDLPKMAHFSIVRRTERKFCSFVERCFEETIKSYQANPVPEKEGSSQYKQKEAPQLVCAEKADDHVSNVGIRQTGLERKPLTELETGMKLLVGVREKSKEEPPPLVCMEKLDFDASELEKERRRTNAENEPPREPESGAKQLACMGEESEESWIHRERRRTRQMKLAALELGEMLDDLLAETTTHGELFEGQQEEKRLALINARDAVNKVKEDCEDFLCKNIGAPTLSEEKRTQCIQLATMFDESGAFNGGELLAKFLGLDSVEALLAKNAMRGEVGDDHWLTFAAVRLLTRGLSGDDNDFLMETIRRASNWIEEQSMFFFQSRHALLEKMVKASGGQ